MVLDNQPTSVQFEPDSPPPSSPDPYSATASAIDFSKLPYGFTLFQFEKDQWRRAILRDLQQHAASVHRPLNPDETTALAYYAANRYATNTWSMPIGCVIAAFRFQRTSENYGLPFLGAMKREGGWFDGTRIQIMGRELLRGKSARLAINAVRGACHTLNAVTFTFLGTASYGAFALVGNIIRDPRLKDYSTEWKAIMDEEMKQRRARGIMGQGGKRDGDLWQGHKDGIDRDTARRDEGSFLAGRNEAENTGDEGTVGGGDFGGAETPVQIKLLETRQQPVLSDSPLSNRTAADRQPIGFTDEYHDSSPSVESDWSQEPSDGGSTWDRIRRGARSPASGKSERREKADSRGKGGWQQQREQGESSGSSRGDDFTFSSSEQERSYAQEEAQRDFDARVEKERQGGEFSEGSGGEGRRWD